MIESISTSASQLSSAVTAQAPAATAQTASPSIAMELPENKFDGVLQNQKGPAFASPESLDPSSRVLTLDRANQVDYFAERIEGTHAKLIDIRRKMARQPNRFERSAVDAFHGCNAQYKELSQFLDGFASGRKYDNRQLMTMQIRSHQIMQNVEILSKTVEQTVSGMKTIFQTSV